MPKALLAVVFLAFTLTLAIAFSGCAPSSPAARASGSGAVSTTNNELVASYAVNAPSGSSVKVEFGPDENYGLTTSAQSAPTGGGTLKLLVAGMRPATTYHMRAVITLGDGSQSVDSDQTFVTGSLGIDQVPQIKVTQSPGSSPQSGVEILDLEGGSNSTFRVVAADLQGNIIWYLPVTLATNSPNPVKPLPDGNMLLNFSVGTSDGMNSLLEEVDLTGNTVWQMSASDLNAALTAAGYDLTVVGTHHDVAVLPNNHLMLIASTNKTFTDLPGYPGDTTVLGDVLIDLDANRKPDWVWSEFDHLDVNRHPMLFPDWTHTNAVLYSASDGDLIVSIRHQSWVIKIDYDDGKGTGDILWKMGSQGDFQLQGGQDPTDWFYAQHGPSIIGGTSAGNFQLVLFDNGNGRPLSLMPCGTSPSCYSSVPILQLDEVAKTATVVWRDTLPIFSSWGGDAQVLANGDVEFDECAPTSSTATVLEVTGEDNPQTVWEMDISGQNAYRAFRVPSLYPGVQW